MKILVFGAGPIGSLYAARMAQGGQEVTVLDRGDRLDDLREHGIVLEDARSGERETHRLPVVEELGEQDDYDLVLVTMRKNAAEEVLPILARNRKVETFLFMMNNPAGPGWIVDELGAERVMLGFPPSGGYFEGPVLRMIDPGTASIPVGEVDGSVKPRTKRVAEAIGAMRHKKVEIRTDMDAWLVTHLSALMGNLGVYAAGLDARRFAETRDAIVLGIRAQREAFRAQRSAGISLCPGYFRVLEWIPEPLLVAGMKKIATTAFYEAGIIGHARSARDEIAVLLDDFRRRVAPGGQPTPALDELARYVDESGALMDEKSREVSMHWGGTVAVGAVVAGMVALFGWLA